jgi:hypothetical protein
MSRKVGGASMTDQPAPPDPDDDAGTRFDAERDGMPRWVKVFVVVAVVVVLLLAAMLITGHRGAERHLGSVGVSAVDVADAPPGVTRSP